MTRIPYPAHDTLDAETSTLLDAYAPLNIFRMMAHAPHLMEPFTRLGGTFLSNGTLDPVTRECVILRVGYLSEATYETAQHEAIGRAVGMSDALIEAVKRGPGAKELTAEQRLAVMFTDCLVERAKPTETHLRPVHAHFGPGGTAELTLLIGYYMMVCRFLETFGVNIEDGGAMGAQVLNT